MDAAAPLPGTALNKFKVVTASLVDIAIDLLLPTLIYLALGPAHLPTSIRLSIGGYVMAAKAASGRAGHGAKRPSAARVAWAVVAAAAATAVTVALHAAGAGTTASIVAGTVVVGVGTALLLRADHRHVDTFAVLVLIELALSVALVLISSDPRFVLARPAAYTAVAGIYILATVRSKPFMMAITRPLAASGDPVRGAAFDRAWNDAPRFRFAERGMTASLGLVLIAEAVLRVVAVYSRPAGAVVSSSLLSQLPGLGLFLAWFLVARFVFVPIASKEVDALAQIQPLPNAVA